MEDGVGVPEDPGVEMAHSDNSKSEFYGSKSIRWISKSEDLDDKRGDEMGIKIDLRAAANVKRQVN